MEQVRLFIALPTPAAVKAELTIVQKTWRGRLPGDHLRWTRPEQIHLTLKFLGNVESALVEELTRTVGEACLRFPPMRLRASGIGFFPSERRLRVVWAGVADERNELPQLQSAIEEAVAQFTTEQKEDSFTGHLTLARVRNIRPNEALKLAALARDWSGHLFGEWTATTVEIIRSEPSAGGNHYSPVAEMRLSG